MPFFLGEDSFDRGAFEISYKTGLTYVTSNVYHDHMNYELYYLVSNTSQHKDFYVEDSMYHMKPGDVMIVPPLVRHRTVNSDVARHSRVILLFDQAFIDPVIALLETADIRSVFFEKERLITLTSVGRSAMDTLLKRMSDELSARQDGFVSMARLHAAQIFVSLLRHSTASNTVESDAARPTAKTIMDVVEYINEHYQSPVSLHTLSSRFYMNASALSRSFKTAMSVPLTEYINQKRIDKAREILEKRNDSIVDISAEVGFSTPNYFVKVFKRFTGISPVAYKKSLKV